MIRGVTPGTYRHKKGGRYLVLHNTATITPEEVASSEYHTLYAAKHAEDCRFALVVVDKRTGILRVLDSGPPGEPIIVYLSLDHGQFWVRPEHEWHDLVDWDGVQKKRFVREDFE